MPKTVKVRSAFVAVACSIALAMSAQADALKQAIDIPAGELAAALKLLAKQSGADLVYRPEQVQGLQTSGVKGELSIEEAVTKLLEGTALKLSTDATGAMLIAAPLPADGRAADRISAVDEIVVTGSRLRVSEAEGAAPVTVFDRARIEELGVSTLADLLKHLPQQPYKRDEGFDSTGAQYAQLRGLGVDSTLVLINGRRVVPSAANISFNGFDLNTIPLVAVERVEVLSDAASAVYGADAMGGVVNILLKRDAPRLSAEASYGSAAGGAEEHRFSISSGYTGDRLRAMFVADYFDRGYLLGKSRDFYSNQDFRRFGGEDWRITSAMPGNVSSVDGSNLPGLSSPQAAVPSGSRGVGLSPVDFLATAGQINLESVNRHISVVPEAQRRSAAGFAEFEFSPALTGFMEALYVDRRTAFQFNPSELVAQLVPAANPFNPFGTDVIVDVLLSGLGPREDLTDSELLRSVAGLRGAWQRWDWEVSVLHTQEEASSLFTNAADAQRVAEALAATDPAQALNVFQDGPGANPALLASLKSAPHEDRYDSKATQVSAFARGPLFAGPAGDIDVVMGGEWRNESMFEDDTFLVSRDRDVAAGYAELRVPLVSSVSQVPALQSLSLTMAARLDHYSDFGDTFNPQYGLMWRPVSDWLVRASYGTSFRPPSLFELYAPRRIRPTRVIDPRRDNERTETSSVAGGNPQLDPIEGTSASAGVVYAPASVSGLRLSANYWRIELERRVAAFSSTLLLQNEAQFPDRVQRAAPTPADVLAGLPGAVTLVDISRINYGSLDTRGVDLEASYAFDSAMGSWASSVAATWVERYRTVDLPNTPANERLGIASTLGSIVRWRLTGSLSWGWRALNISASARYVPGYHDADPLTRQPNGRDIAAQTLVDLQTSIDLGDFGEPAAWWRRDCKITAGVTNLFDEAPSFSQIGFDAGFDPSQADLRQRFGYVRVAKSF